MTDQLDTLPQIKATLYKKMAAVMSDLGSIANDKKHAQGYMYASATAVANEIRKHMSAHGIAFFAGVVRSENFDDSYLITYEFTFACADTGATESRLWQQEAMKKVGNYRDDKAFGKAATYAEKYFLMKTFVVSSEDDPDTDDDHPAPPVQRQQKPTNGNHAPPPTERPTVPPSQNGNAPQDKPATPKSAAPAQPVVSNETKTEALSVVTIEKFGKDGRRMVTSTGSYSYTRQPFTDAGIDTAEWTQPGIYQFGKAYNVISVWHVPEDPKAKAYWKIDRLEPIDQPLERFPAPEGAKDIPF